jgi:UDP-glucose 4-epimerase
MPKTRVLVTGAAGFTRPHVAEQCLALDMEVVATDNLSGGFMSNVHRFPTVLVSETDGLNDT